jgi:CxxC motif-containing protein
LTDGRRLTCIACPAGCTLRARETPEGIAVLGAGCDRGREYAESEWTQPVRRFTGTVRVVGSALRLVPVKADPPVPRERLLELAREVARMTVTAPIAAGDVLGEVLGGEARLIATADVGCVDA